MTYNAIVPSNINPITPLPGPTQVEGVRKLGHIALEQGRGNDAVDLFTRWTQLEPHEAGAYMALASALILMKRLAEATAVLETACSLAPGDLGMQKLLVNLLSAQGRGAESAVHLRHALVLDPGNMELLAQLCQALTNGGDAAGAMDCLMQMLVKSSRERHILQAVETVARQLQRHDLASLASRQLAALNGPPQMKLAVANIEITTFCNLKCTGCCRTVGVTGGTWKNNHMSIEGFKKIVEEMPPTAVLVPYGIGEPMLHPEIFEIIKIAKSAPKFGQVMLTSNATARKIEDFEQLFELGLDRLCISVDSLDAEIINQVRPGTDVDKLLLRLRHLARKYPGRVEIRSVVGKNNVHALPSLLTTLNEIGRMDTYFQPYDDVGNPAGCMSADERRSTLAFLQNRASNYPNLNIVPQGFTPQPGICSMPWDAPFITANGDVTPCCRIVDPKVGTFGNALEKPFNEVWTSAETNAWRESFKKHSPEMCRGCPIYAFREDPNKPNKGCACGPA